MPKYAGRATRRPSIRRAGAARDVVVRVTQDGTRTSPVSEIAITAPSPRRALEASRRARSHRERVFRVCGSARARNVAPGAVTGDRARLRPARRARDAHERDEGVCNVDAVARAPRRDRARARPAGAIRPSRGETLFLPKRVSGRIARTTARDRRFLPRSPRRDALAAAEGPVAARRAAPAPARSSDG